MKANANELKFEFNIFVCTSSDGIFKKGSCYPVCGYNNGIHLMHSNETGDAELMLLHCYGYCFMDSSGSCEAEFVPLAGFYEI